jgi:hypothetical protein
MAYSGIDDLQRRDYSVLIPLLKWMAKNNPEELGQLLRAHCREVLLGAAQSEKEPTVEKERQPRDGKELQPREGIERQSDHR